MVKSRGPAILAFSLCILLAAVSNGFGGEDPPIYESAAQLSPDWGKQVAQAPTEEPQRLAQGVVPVAPGAAKGEEPAEAEPVDVPDPLEPMNRAFYQFNDRLYFWVLKPVARGYKAVVPEPARVSVRNFFYNVAFPIRFVNCLLQGKGRGAADEFSMFMVNSIFGVAGFLDVIPEDAKIKRHNEDLGQTFGRYGMGPGFYLVLPLFGPSTARDSVGSVGDSFLNPVNYLDFWYNAGIRVYTTVNETSLRIGEYEALKRAAIDPYIALRNAYYQNRVSLIKE